jgi:translation initiation factor IF-3
VILRKPNDTNKSSAGTDGHLVNQDIRHKVMQVIDETGANLGELSRDAALQRAAAAGLDLVLISEKEDKAIAKIMDFGKFLYGKKKKQAQSKKSQKVIQIKEIKMRPKIGVGDYETKMGQAVDFLGSGKHVKFTVQFRGRQPVSVNEVAIQFFDKIKAYLAEKGFTNLVEEKESRSKVAWSRVIYVKQ